MTSTAGDVPVQDATSAAGELMAGVGLSLEQLFSNSQADAPGAGDAAASVAAEATQSGVPGAEAASGGMEVAADFAEAAALAGGGNQVAASAAKAASGAGVGAKAVAGAGIADGAAVQAAMDAGGAVEAFGALTAVGSEAAAVAVSVAEAGTLGALAGGYAGLVVGGLTEPVRTKDSDFYLEPSNKITPGTIRAQSTSPGEEPPAEDRPMSAAKLGWVHFEREWKQLLRAAGAPAGGAKPRRHVPSFVSTLQLSNQAVLERERARPEVPTPGPVRVSYDVLCWFIDVVFEDRPIQRFWFLETVARMPYFAYTSVLHLYETLGWWRSPELRAVHVAEEDNELHHLLIMESLGGDQRWLDRFFAQHGAIAYYWILIIFFVIDPRWSYNFSRLIEAHAVDTYGEFVDANEERLKRIPPPPVAVEYYLAGDLYMFDKFQTAKIGKDLRRPPCATLYDVFCNICDDEEQHVLTMEACEQWVVGGAPPVPLGFNRLSHEEYRHKVLRDPEAHAAWEAWGEEIAAAAREAGRQR